MYVTVHMCMHFNAENTKKESCFFITIDLTLTLKTLIFGFFQPEQNLECWSINNLIIVNVKQTQLLYSTSRHSVL